VKSVKIEQTQLQARLDVDAISVTPRPLYPEERALGMQWSDNHLMGAAVGK
jgi:hypothetical protein